MLSRCELSRRAFPFACTFGLPRLDVNRLFTARSQRQFRLELTGGELQSHVKDHAGESDHQQTVPKRSVIGIGGQQLYTVYNPATDRIEFLSAGESSKQPARRVGFGFG